MFNNPNTDSNMDPAMGNPLMGQQFMEGAPVYDINGEKVGDVSEHLVQQGNLVIHRGLLKKDVYLPLNTIMRNDPNGVYLSIGKDEVKDLEDVGPMEGNQRQAAMGAEQQPMQATQAVREEGMVIPVHEEQMRVERVPDEQMSGDVRVRRGVTEQEQTISTPVTHEELRVEHRPAQGNMPVGEDAFTEKQMEVPLRGERLEVSKEPRVTDEVRLRKQQVTEEQQATGTVRKEHVEVEGVDQPGENLDPRNTTNRDVPNRDVPPNRDGGVQNAPRQP